MTGKYEHLITDNIQEMVSNMNGLFGNNPLDMSRPELWINDVVSQSSNIFDEIEELEEAVAQSDEVEVIDAVGDILTFAMGVDHLMGKVISLSDIRIGRSFNKTRVDIIDELYSSYRELMSTLSLLGDNPTDTDFAYFNSILMRICELSISSELLSPKTNIVDVMKEITRSNHTKLCTTEQDTNDTLAYYESLGIEVYSDVVHFKGDSHWVVRSSKEQLDKNGKMYRKDKFLKCTSTYTPPNLLQFV